MMFFIQKNISNNSHGMAYHISVLLNNLLMANIFRRLQENPLFHDGTRVTEPFFIVNGFWRLMDSDSKDHYERSSVGLQRSSPRYFNQNLRRVSECYFGGTFKNPILHEMIITIEKKTRNQRDTIENVINGFPKDKSYYAKSFLSCLNAYLHSPIQTKKPREPIHNAEAENALRNLVPRMAIFLFVQKVEFDKLGKWPKIAIVSLLVYSISS